MAADIRWALESLRFERAQLEAEAERERVELAKCWSATHVIPSSRWAIELEAFSPRADEVSVLTSIA
jgi:hypothetical protein